MPKKKRVFTKVLYCYTTPANRKFLEEYSKKHSVSYSWFVDTLLEAARKKLQKTPNTQASA